MSEHRIRKRSKPRPFTRKRHEGEISLPRIASLTCWKYGKTFAKLPDGSVWYVKGQTDERSVHARFHLTYPACQGVLRKTVKCSYCQGRGRTIVCKPPLGWLPVNYYGYGLKGS